MLKLRNVCKYYQNGKNKNVILDNITLDFKKKELVFIIGASGSGKTTLLNIIGGNLRSESGEIYLGDLLVNSFNDKELNNYRISIVGNIFQDYNLIDYMTVWDNIMLGYSNIIDKIKINLLLKQLDIYDKRKMVVSKLSGGEKQRVAIARAIVNDPKIILADEPTGALDSRNGIQIMEILKKLSKNKLVIVVSHDNYLASKYADRIINIKDGKCEYFPQVDEDEKYVIEKRKISKKKIIKLAIKNLWFKKWRTLMTSLAISLGIISMLLVLCLFNGFNKEINLLEKEVVSLFPINISNGDFEILDSKIEKSNSMIIIKDREKFIHTNKINKEYIDYLNDIKEIKYINYNYDISMPIISDSYENVNNKYLEMISDSKFINDNYEIIYGRNIEDDNEVLLKVDSNNNVSSELLNSFMIDDNIDYNIIVGRKMKAILNDDYYIKNGEYYLVNSDNQEVYNKSDLELVIVGIVREKEVINDNSMILYCNDFLDKLFNINKNSRIVKSQIKNQYNVLGLNIDRDMMLSYLGYNSLPSNINIFIYNIIDKEKVIDKLDNYNENNDKLIYIDTMADAIEIIKNFILIISIILISFSMIAILISSLMIGILTNVRVLERKKEIGIFRSLGASKRNVLKLFNTENLIIAIISSLIGVLVVFLLSDFVNQLLYNLLEIDNIFYIQIEIVFLVVFFNILIVRLSGSFPARKASKLEIVKCIYNR